MTVTASPASRATEILSRPVALNGLTVPNRIVMAPMTRMFSPGGVPGEDVRSYYARRAAAGVGLIVTEGTYVGHESAGQSDRVPRFHGEEQLAGWAKVAEAVHAAGGTIVPQLWHIGMVREQGQAPYPDAPAMGPSGIRVDGTEDTGRAMTRGDLDDVIGAFAEAAAAAERIGFDGVELHGAHGYLVDQFLWERTNRRTDAYGGDAVSRTKFAAEIVAAVRAAVSPGFPVIFRYSQWKQEAYDARLAETPQELEAILAPLASAGVDAFHASTRRYWLPEFEDSDLNLAGWTRKLTGRPTITVGSVGLDGDFIHAFAGRGAGLGSLDNLLDRLERDEFDLVAVGRALLQDPQWASKVLAGRTDELKPYDAAALKTLS
ncbi:MULTISPECIES: NADH:flavin oxidoreductase [Streptomyces]|uniref:NADH:flavin oxidoreductase n=1 Tax=Streptomyces cinereoruber TaxID=67260 RepID=A0ABX6B780_9ACTN|nr:MULTISPECIES: NADH:flavin oxidoreductase [Streptomyces]MBB4158835.1 2,4-dienoyl-CoA reductase-like NADH-dependent reductase (Old Yellow Enzyme family) [Streptomyces cinereoruber]MBY8816565.1 NADH:flavin oxidoreductase [Streptomyces cinereoruber]NIH65233.1 2,4-dienoyl-CoA reductase-like NADH-dependent reductase (Old Yellow Enzyme family) [Streptomyces cinereoruber]PVC69457.1 12-oxophytodienoate reductase [Streptomyces sp. CS081A]QEV31044.1 NADH:flavin oxidoreductase [Streptomyces cinereorube